MDVNVREDDTQIEIVPVGNLDSKGSVDLQNALNEIFEKKTGVRCVIDFTSIPFVSSAGLRVLLLAMKKITAGGGSLELTNLSESTKEVFNMTGFSSILKIV
ncbi:MAG: STAS domain-containing protein [Synergistaceae bacterium]|jgi:anti-anti-sigma factor|nr:STAS domain-containing protein [Synergistaceae bacterium]